MTQSQQEVEIIDRDVRLFIYQYFGDTGRAPGVAEIAQEVQRPELMIQESLKRLEAKHALTLAPTTSNIWMAHPFSAVPTPYQVKANDRSYWANCAWDALGIPAVLAVDAKTEASCADCNASLTITVKDGELVLSEGVIHFAVLPRHFWDNIAFT